MPFLALLREGSFIHIHFEVTVLCFRYIYSMYEYKSSTGNLGNQSIEVQVHIATI
jgi:hypothetical protein